MRPFLVSLVLCLLVGSAHAAAPYLVTDLKTSSDFPESSDAIYLGTLNGIVFFGAQTADDTFALWRTDGTPAGTFSLLALTSGGNLGFPYAGFVSSGGFAYIGARDPAGWKVWKSDGSVAGTTAVTPATAEWQSPYGAVQGRILIMRLSAAASELWVYDASGFHRLATIRTGVAQFESVASMGGNLFIGNNSGLWKSDGTESGTAKISTTGAFALAAAGNRLFFAGVSAETGAEPWVTDGTAAGTHLVTDLRAGTPSTFAYGRSVITAFGNGVAFTGANGEFGVSDGTAQGTRVVRTGAKPNSLPAIGVLNGVALFAFDDGTHGRELWRSDGTDAGTRIVRDHDRSAADITNIAVGATRIYYYDVAGASLQSLELFESDGTEAGTHAVHHPVGTKWVGSRTALLTLITIGDTVVFNADDGEHGAEPWISDGTDAGTRLVANVAADQSGSAFPGDFLAGADRLYFTAQDNDSYGVWATDGTDAGTRRVMNGATIPLAVNGNTLYMKRSGASETSTINPQLWKSEGGAPGSETLVKDFGRSNSPDVEGVYVIGGKVYVRANDGRDRALWITDGTTAGTTKLTDLDIDFPTAPASLANRAYFITYNNGVLFATDGTPESTRSVAHTVNTVRPDSDVIPFGGSLLFFADARSPDESLLWRFAGTAADAAIVKHFPRDGSSHRPETASIGSALLFTWKSSLWKTDGTSEGTQVVRDFGAAAPRSLTSLGTRIVFALDDGVDGVEPWISDGTADGTKLLRDINLGSASSEPIFFVVADGIAYFNATDAEHGAELWQSDGTPEGTQLVADIQPGPKGSTPVRMTRFGNALYFAANTDATGYELWAYPLPAPAIAVDDVRVRENAANATLTIRLTQPAAQHVSVDYETVDATAKSGRDYVAKSGSVAFERGESAKTISIPIVDDAAAGATRSFNVRLHNANAPIERSSGAVIIEDDDTIADLVLALTATDFQPLVSVTNNGPSAASNVRLCTATVPTQLAFNCTERFELKAGQTRTQQVSASIAVSILAKATAWEPDSNPANNAASWLVARETTIGSLYVSPQNPRAGETGLLTVGQNKYSDPTDVQLTSSDPAVVSVPATVTIPGGAATASTTFNALKRGTATITAKLRFDIAKTVVVHVAGAGESTRAVPSTLIDASSVWDFGKANVLRVWVKGLALDGAQPTGSVQFFENGTLRGSAPVVGQFAQLTISDPLLGRPAYSAVYSGDANFFEAAVEPYSIFVRQGTALISAGVLPGSTNVVIVVRGISGYPPAGTITVTENGAARPVSGPLAPSSSTSSSATSRGFSSVPRTVTVVYSGDLHYEPATVTIPVGGPHVRSVRH